MYKTFNTLIIKLLVFAVILAIVDFVVGKAFFVIKEKALNLSPYNLNQKTPFMVEKVNTDVVIVGASDASHHYIPQLIADSLNLSVYNGGQDGCFFLYQNCLINLMLERYSPKVIIWEIGKDCLSIDTDTISEYQSISGLFPYYDDEYVRSVIDNKKDSQKVKMISSMYRNNSKLHIFLYNFIVKDDYDCGYVPLENKGYLYPTLQTATLVQGINEKKVLMLENTLDKCKENGVELILSSSPQYSDGYFQSTLQYKKLKDIARKNSIPFIDSYDNHEVYLDATLFKDVNHLNDKGARLYMQWFIPELKKKLQKE